MVKKDNQELELLEKLDQEKKEQLKRIVSRLPELEKAVESLAELVDSGALETIVNLIYMVHLSKRIVSDEMVSGTANIANNLLDISSKLTMPTMKKLISAVLDHQIEIEEEINNTKITGFWSLMKAMKDKDVQRGLSVVIAILKVLGRYTMEKEREKEN